MSLSIILTGSVLFFELFFVERGLVIQALRGKLGVLFGPNVVPFLVFSR